MQSGPYLASLEKGKHTVHFRISVDSTNTSAAALVRLDVRENKGGAVLAHRDVAWNQFAAAGETEDFALAFANDAPGAPLEFRVFWNNASPAPALTLSDVSVDGFFNWTAANLDHDVGQLDGMNTWCADPARNRASGFLARGADLRGLSAGPHSATFELKVDNFNWDNSKVATMSVVDADTGNAVISRDMARSDFSTILYQSVVLKFNAVAGQRYDFRTFWHYAPRAPRLTERSVIVN
jgi:hypothetical protein